MLIRTVVVTPFSQNARVLIDEASREAVVVDPGGEIERLLPALNLRGEPLQVKQIFLTHSHIDHVGGVVRLCEVLEKAHGVRPETLAHEAERELRASVRGTARFFGMNPEDYDDMPEPDRYIREGDEIVIGAAKGKLLFTPGHSPGHLSLYFPQQAFTLEELRGKAEQINAPLLIGGDLIFKGSIGRTDLPGGDFETLLGSVREKIFTLPDETRILCGHGEDTSVGTEKLTNPFFT